MADDEQKETRATEEEPETTPVTEGGETPEGDSQDTDVSGEIGSDSTADGPDETPSVEVDLAGEAEVSDEASSVEVDLAGEAEVSDEAVSVEVDLADGLEEASSADEAAQGAGESGDDESITVEATSKEDELPVKESPAENGGAEKVDEGKEPEKAKKTTSKKEKQKDVFLGPKPLVFGFWDPTEVVIEDPSVRQYVNLQPVVVPHTGARKGRKRLAKNDVSIVERLINNVMRNEKNTGAKQRAYFIVRDAFLIIEKRMQRNPIQVLAEAIANAGPREETVRLRYGGINVPKAVDTSPQRRVDRALMFIAKGAEKSSFKSKRSISQCLANEIIAASEADAKCFSVSRKEEKERVAKAAR